MPSLLAGLPRRLLARAYGLIWFIFSSENGVKLSYTREGAFVAWSVHDPEPLERVPQFARPQIRCGDLLGIAVTKATAIPAIALRGDLVAAGLPVYLLVEALGVERAGRGRDPPVRDCGKSGASKLNPFPPGALPSGHRPVGKLPFSWELRCSRYCTVAAHHDFRGS
jgi:hypothetical protein